MSNDIGSFFSGAIQSIEQNVESGVENMFSGKSGSSGSSTAGGAQGSNSLGGFDIGALFGSGNNGIGALFGSGSNGLFGELFAKLGGSELGIIGNLFQGNTNKSQQGNGYAPPPAGNGGTYVPPPPPGNTQTQGSPPLHVSPCGGDITPGTTGTTGTQPATSNADPRMNDAIAALETLMMNFSKCSSNGQMTPASLQQAAWDPSNPDLQNAAKFFTSNPDLMRDLFVKGGGSSASFDQLNSLDGMWTQMQKSTGSTGSGSTGTTPRFDPTKLISGVLGSTGTNTTGGASTGTGDASMIAQLEQQIAQLQQQLNGMGTGSLGSSQPASINSNLVTTSSSGGGTADSISKLDDGIAGYQGDIEKQIKIMSDPNATDAQKQAAQSQIQLDTMHMQQEMDALKQLFEMLSNMEKAYSDICMNAISNMR